MEDFIKCKHCRSRSLLPVLRFSLPEVVAEELLKPHTSFMETFFKLGGRNFAAPPKKILNPTETGLFVGSFS